MKARTRTTWGLLLLMLAVMLLMMAEEVKAKKKCGFEMEKSKTIVGLEGTLDSRLVDSLRVGAVRFVVTERLMQRVVDGKEDGLIEEIQRVKQRGAEVVLTMRFPDASFPDLKDRIPLDDRQAALDLAEAFVRQVAEWTSWVQVQDEVLGGRGEVGADKMEGGLNSEAMKWFLSLAQLLLRVRCDLPNSQARWGIVSPALTGTSLLGRLSVGSLPSGSLASLRHHLAQAILQSSSSWDLVDVHLETSSVAELTEGLKYTSALSTLPLTCLRWSQAPRALSSSWLSSPSPLSSSSSSSSSSDPAEQVVTNYDVLRHSYLEPYEPKEWTGALALPYDKTFSVASYDLLRSFSLRHMCLSSVFQLYLPDLDWRSPFASLSSSTPDPFSSRLPHLFHLPPRSIPISIPIPFTSSANSSLSDDPSSTRSERSTGPTGSTRSEVREERSEVAVEREEGQREERGEKGKEKGKKEYMTAEETRAKRVEEQEKYLAPSAVLVRQDPPLSDFEHLVLYWSSHDQPDFNSTLFEDITPSSVVYFVLEDLHLPGNSSLSLSPSLFLFLSFLISFAFLFFFF